MSIKWPNDIYWNDRKLGGTLTECGLNGQSLKWCIIGTGALKVVVQILVSLFDGGVMIV